MIRYALGSIAVAAFFYGFMIFGLSMGVEL